MTRDALPLPPTAAQHDGAQAVQPEHETPRKASPPPPSTPGPSASSLSDEITAAVLRNLGQSDPAHFGPHSYGRAVPYGHTLYSATPRAAAYGLSPFADARSSSPIPMDDDFSVEDYGKLLGLKVEWVTMLKAMGFIPGQKLDDVTKEDWKEAGFKVLEWARIRTLDKKHRGELKHLLK